MKDKDRSEIPGRAFVSSIPGILLGTGLLSKSAYPFKESHMSHVVKGSGLTIEDLVDVSRHGTNVKIELKRRSEP